MKLRRVGFALLGIVCACGGNAVTVCPSDLHSSITPKDTTILAGEQFTARLSLLGCGGTKVLSDTVTFQSSDLSVAVVGTTTGTVIGAHPGAAIIRATARHYGVSEDVHVVVQ